MEQQCPPGVAYTMGTLNEWRGYANVLFFGPMNIAAARFMDLHNNREGRREGRPINESNLILHALSTVESARANHERYKCDCDGSHFFQSQMRGPTQNYSATFGTALKTTSNGTSEPTYYDDVSTYR